MGVRDVARRKPGIRGNRPAAATALAAGLVAVVWRRNLPLPIRATSLVSATLVAVPLALFYDLVLAGVAAAWLLRSDGEYRLRRGPAKPALAALYVLSLNPRGIAAAWHLPIGTLLVVLRADDPYRCLVALPVAGNAAQGPRRRATKPTGGLGRALTPCVCGRGIAAGGSNPRPGRP